MHTPQAQESARSSTPSFGQKSLPTQAGRFSLLALCLLAGLCCSAWLSSAPRGAAANFQMIRIGPDKLPVGVIGVPYQVELRASGGGSSSYTFTLDNDVRDCLPIGLQLENGTPDDTALLRGTPQEAGLFTFTVKVTSPPAFAARRQFTIFVRARNDCPTLGLVEHMPCNPQLKLGEFYTETFDVVGPGTPPYQFTVEQRVCERLPLGMELVPGPGADQVTLRGTPVETGLFSFHIRVEDANGCYGVICHDYPVRTRAECLLNLLPENLADVDSLQGEALALNFTPTGGSAPYAFSLDQRPGERVPQGLRLGANAAADQALLSGAPQEAGTFCFTLRAKDKNGCEITHSYTLVVRSKIPANQPPECPAVTLEPELLFNGTLTSGATFTQTFTAKDGAPPYTFSVEPLPAGLQILQMTSGTGDQVTLSGVPVQLGSLDFTVKATDKNGCVGTRTYVLNVRSSSDCPVISFLPRSLPNGIVGNVYAAQPIIQQPADRAYSLSLSNGALPPGLIFVGNILQGTPTRAGDFMFTLKAQSGSCSGEHEYKVSIAAPIVCPPNLTQPLAANADEAVVHYAPPAAPPGNVVTCAPASGSTFKRGTTTVTCVSAGTAPTTSCSFTVTLTTCAVSCPAPVMATLAAGQCVTRVNYAAPVVTGACNTVTCTPPSGADFAAGVTTVTCTATDGGNGNSTCSFTVTVNDTEAPVIACPENLTRPAEQNQCSAVVNYAPPRVTDNCAGATVSCTPAAGTSLPLGTTTVTCTATDAAQNKSTCSFSVTVNDTQAPTLVCPANLVRTLEPNQCAAVVSYNAPAASDNCAGVGTPVCAPPSGSSFAAGVTTVTCTVRDAAQNQATCSFTVTVNDTQAPVITCPENQRLVTSGPAAVRYALPTATDNCANPAVNCVPASGAAFPLGVTTVTCTATDAANNRATCSFTVTLTTCDIPPPPHVTVNVEQGQCAKTVTYSLPNTSGSCGAVTCTPAPGATFAVGVTTVSCESSDALGIKSSASFTVTVKDTQAPVIACPAPLRVLADGPSVVNYSAPVATDNCATPLVTCNPPANTTFPLGVTTVTCTATDGSGNTKTCDFPVTVTPCAITCPAPVTVNAATGQCAAVVNYPAPTVSGTCTATCVPPAGSTFVVGVTTVNCSVSDANNVASTCSFTVMVNDTQAPVPVCPANIVRANDAGQCQAVVNYPAPTVTDNCPGATISCTPASGAAFAKGVTTVTCTAKDTAGNTAQCSFTVTVNDTEPPKLACPANQTITSNGPVAVIYSLPAATDNCAGVGTPVCLPPSGAIFPVGTTTVNCSVSDAANNTSTCSFVVQVKTCTLTCPEPLTVNTDAGQCAALVNYTMPATNGCGTVTCTPPPGSTFALGVTTVTCTASDPNVTPRTCSFTVTVNDRQAPTITCPANITRAADANACAAVVTYPNPNVNDNCSGVGTPVCAPASGSSFAIGTTTVTCTVRDAAQNQGTCSFTVTVNDTQAPVIACPANVSKVADANACAATVTYANPAVSDNCAGIGAPVCTPPSGTSFVVGTTTVTCTVRDAAQNQAACSFIVTVTDDQKPVIACPAPINLTAAVPTVVTYPLPTVTDNCAGVRVPVCSPASGTTFAVGTTTVTCTVTDASDNSATCSFPVTVGPCPLSVTGAPIDFGAARAAGLTPDAQAVKQVVTLTNNKCGEVTFGLALQRRDDNTRINDKNDARAIDEINGVRSLSTTDRRPFYVRRNDTNALVKLCSPAQANQDASCDSFTLPTNGTLTLTLYFDPLVPARASGSGNVNAAQVLPETVLTQLLLKPAVGSTLQSNQELSALTARVIPQLRYVQPCDPKLDPAKNTVVTFTRAGNQFVVQPTLYDPGRTLQSVRFEFLDEGNGLVQTIELGTEITNVINNSQTLLRGQTFSFIQSFSNASAYPEVRRVRVTLNNDAALTTVAGDVGCSLSSNVIAFQAAPPEESEPPVMPDRELPQRLRLPRPASNQSSNPFRRRP